MVPTVSNPEGLKALARKLGVRPDWHEPDEQEVTARVFGACFDNAGFYGEGSGPNGRISSPDAEELFVRLYQDGQPVADINLATLFAMAARQ